jgi:hypothetical protein
MNGSCADLGITINKIPKFKCQIPNKFQRTISTLKVETIPSHWEGWGGTFWEFFAMTIVQLLFF